MAMATASPTRAVSLHWPLTDDEFAKLCALNPEIRLEYTCTGDLIIMPPTGMDTGERNASLTAAFVVWNRTQGRGVVCDASSGFLLPNGAKRSPDVSWITLARRNALTEEQRRGFPPLCPDFVLALRSSSDRLPDLQEKMQEYVENGARLGWLIDPIERVVYVYRPGDTVERLDDPREVLGEPVLAGFVLRLSDIW